MSDIGADADAVREMVAAAENRLIAKNDGNPLVAYLFITDDTERNKAWQAQLKTFSKDPTAPGNVAGDMATTDAMTEYLFALEIALGEREAPSQTTETSG